MKYAESARMAVAREVYKEYWGGESIDIKYLDIYVVWACHILGNEKYLISTNIPNNKYYEVTVDTKEHVMYVDTYVKESQEVIYLNCDAQEDSSSD